MPSSLKIGPADPREGRSPSEDPQSFAHAPTEGENAAAVLTFVLCLFFITVTALGLALPYPKLFRIEQPEIAQIVAERVEVELAKESSVRSTVAEPPPTESNLQPPPMEETPAILVPPSSALTPLKPSIAFPVPVDGSARASASSPVDRQRPFAPSSPSTTSSPVAKQITLGQGEGKQAAPEYPLLARRQGQEGTVVILLKVGEDGQVQAAEAISPSPWPLLNEAALRVVREKWKFLAGPVRFYEAPIRFQITK